MKLYTKNDIERAARLAVLYHVKGDDPETCIADAARLVASDSPEYFDARTVKRMLEYCYNGTLVDADYDRLFEEALQYAQR